MTRHLRMITSGCVVTGLLLSGSWHAVHAQDRGDVHAAGASCNPNLNFPFPASGAGATSFNICLSSEGNVVKFEAPGGSDHSLGYEGYKLCAPTGTYYDLGAGGAAGFNPAVITQPNGPGKFPVTIVRQTFDGHWEIKQTYARDTNEQDLTITMTVKKLGTPIGGGGAVYLTRWSDFNADGSVFDDTGDISADSIWARQTRAVTLTAMTLATSRTTALSTWPFGSAFATTPVSCTDASAATPIAAADLAGQVTYNLGTIFNVNATKTVKFLWSRK